MRMRMIFKTHINSHRFIPSTRPPDPSSLELPHPASGIKKQQHASPPPRSQNTNRTALHSINDAKPNQTKPNPSFHPTHPSCTHEETHTLGARGTRCVSDLQVSRACETETFGRTDAGAGRRGVRGLVRLVGDDNLCFVIYVLCLGCIGRRG